MYVKVRKAALFPGVADIMVKNGVPASRLGLFQINRGDYSTSGVKQESAKMTRRLVAGRER